MRMTLGTTSSCQSMFGGRACLNSSTCEFSYLLRPMSLGPDRNIDSAGGTGTAPAFDHKRYSMALGPVRLSLPLKVLTKEGMNWELERPCAKICLTVSSCSFFELVYVDAGDSRDWWSLSSDFHSILLAHVCYLAGKRCRVPDGL